MKRSDIRRHNIRVYVARGMSTREIAPLVGMAPESVNRIRRALGIPARNVTQFKRWVPGDDPRVGQMTRMAAMGMRDRDIADRLGVTLWTIGNWRSRLAIGKPHTTLKMPATQQETLAAIVAPATAPEIAERLGISVIAVHGRLAALRRRGFVNHVGWTGPTCLGGRKLIQISAAGRDALDARRCRKEMCPGQRMSRVTG